MFRLWTHERLKICVNNTKSPKLPSAQSDLPEEVPSCLSELLYRTEVVLGDFGAILLRPWLWHRLRVCPIEGYFKVVSSVTYAPAKLIKIAHPQG